MASSPGQGWQLLAWLGVWFLEDLYLHPVGSQALELLREFSKGRG